MSNKAPKARTNSAKSISKVIQLSKEYNQQHTGTAAMIHISGGNAKLGSIMNISLPPVVTCHNCSSCKNYCYAVRNYLRAPGVYNAWNENYLLFLTEPGRYFSEISKAVKTQRFFPLACFRGYRQWAVFGRYDQSSRTKSKV